MKTISPSKSKTTFPVLFSLPVTAKLDLPPRAEILPQIESGAVDHLDFTAKVFGTGRNRNPYLFKDADLPGFAASFEGQPYLRDHETGAIDARDGTIMDSRLDGGAFVQDIRLTTRRGMTDFVEGKMDRFSIGWFYDDVMCTICNSSYFSPSCNHYPGQKYQTPDGEKTCMLLFINPQGRETSAVNSPAVMGTVVIDARLQEFKLSLLETPLTVTTEVVTTLPKTAEVVTTVVSTIKNSEESQLAEQPASVDGQAASTEVDEAQVAQVRQASHARQLELAELYVLKGAPIMNIRELMAQQAAKIDRARELANLADSESRDFSDEERTEYQAALAEAKTQGEKIAQVQAERLELQDAETLQAKLAENKAEKPAPGAKTKLMKRAEFDKLETLDQAAYIKAGGKLEE